MCAIFCETFAAFERYPAFENGVMTFFDDVQWHSLTTGTGHSVTDGWGDYYTTTKLRLR